MTCTTCGGEVGEHFGQCPEGSLALPLPQFFRGHAAQTVNTPRDDLRLALVDQDPEQPSLFEE